ncbi:MULTISPECIES: hypothetical protein [Aerosakkonema]|uniref:hypothetical protein n=1 Tax=Aerosakkonema TaxID=1246629 RepID=UPI0035B82F7A
MNSRVYSYNCDTHSSKSAVCWDLTKELGHEMPGAATAGTPITADIYAHDVV